MDLSGHHLPVNMSCEDWELPSNLMNTLNEGIQELLQPQWKGLNTGFQDIPHMHPHAQLAVENSEDADWTDDGTLHVYTDGACRAGKAAWAFVVLQQSRQQDREVYKKVGFAAGPLNEGLNACEVNALNAEATAFIAAAEFMLSQPDIAGMNIQYHFDAQAVGHGAVGLSNCCTLHGINAQRQIAARIRLLWCNVKPEASKEHMCTHTWDIHGMN